MMDFEDREDEQEGLPKWPFLASALFIFFSAGGFAYFHYYSSGKLDVWQLLVCIIASGTASLLTFLPFLLERSLQLCLLTANRKDDELFRKVYFDLKEVRNDLEALAVKIDKVPTLVDRIVSDSGKDKSNIEQISSELNEAKEVLALKIGRIEELTNQDPIPQDPDPAIAQIKESVSTISISHEQICTQIKEISNRIDKLPTEFPSPVVHEVSTNPAGIDFEEEIISEVDIADSEESKDLEREREIKGILDEDAFPTEFPDQETLHPNMVEENEEPDENEINEEVTEVENKSFEDPSTSELDNKLESSLQVESDISDPDTLEIEQIEPKSIDYDEDLSLTENPEELDLGLPDPEETLRKVDALLAGESTTIRSEESSKPENTKTVKKTGEITSIVANVMIGIGNKPYVRGEGPGLNWEEGVAMNFVEIGKWAWSPPRKNASLTIQIYRNDEDPDKRGKFEVKPGDKLEVTPEF